MKKRIVVIAIVLTLVLSIGVFAACDTISGSNGLSAYDIACKNGFVGTEKEWLESLKGSDSGKSAYELAVDSGYFEGTLEDWLDSLKGEDGKDGENGKDGKDGQDIAIEDIYTSWLAQGNEGTFNDFLKEYLGGLVINNTTTSYINRAILSVVSVFTTYTKTEQVYVGGFFNGHYENQDSTYSSAGAGVIYKLNKETGDAYVITNYHVVYDVDCNTENHISDKINLYLYGMQRDEYKIPATYVGGALTYDIAVLKVEGSDILKESAARACDVVNSNDLTVGQTTIAIGNPEADGISVTQGILSVDSEYMSMTGADKVTSVDLRTLRIDAPVNEGNSGGGLFNDKGQLIGIVNAKIISSNVESIGYAIPSNIATYVADNIIDNCDGVTSTQVKKCLLGITVENVASRAEYDKATQLTHIIETSRVKEIGENSVLAKNENAEQNVQVGDVLVSLKVGDRLFEVNRQFIIIDAMLTVRPGDELTLTVIRDGEQVELHAVASESCMQLVK